MFDRDKPIEKILVPFTPHDFLTLGSLVKIKSGSVNVEPGMDINVTEGWEYPQQGHVRIVIDVYKLGLPRTTEEGENNETTIIGWP